MKLIQAALQAVVRVVVRVMHPQACFHINNPFFTERRALILQGEDRKTLILSRAMSKF